MVTPADSDDAATPDEQARDLERDVRALCDAGDVGTATTKLIEGYGGELFGYLMALARASSDVDELFSDLCERLWRGLPRFRWESSVRTWSYTVARNLVRQAHRDGRRRGSPVPLSEAPEIARAANAVRTTTVLYLRTEVRQRLDALREALDEDDRTLLVLRVDRRMAWRDIARVMADDVDDLAKVAARLRKRFERVKERLRAELRPGSE